MKNVKKILALVLALVMLAIVCVGCSKTQTPATNDGESTSSEQTQGEAGGRTDYAAAGKRRSSRRNS